jgi:hypothetical protein
MMLSLRGAASDEAISVFRQGLLRGVYLACASAAGTGERTE